MKCNNCNTDNDYGAKFCRKCGASLITIPSKNNPLWYKTILFFAILIIGYGIIALITRQDEFILISQPRIHEGYLYGEYMYEYFCTDALHFIKTKGSNSGLIESKVLRNANGEAISNYNVICIGLIISALSLIIIAFFTRKIFDHKYGHKRQHSQK